MKRATAHAIASLLDALVIGGVIIGALGAIEALAHLLHHLLRIALP